MVCALPGAMVMDVSEWLQYILKRNDEQPEVVAHVGTNNITRKRDVVLHSEYR